MYVTTDGLWTLVSEDRWVDRLKVFAIVAQTSSLYTRIMLAKRLEIAYLYNN